MQHRDVSQSYYGMPKSKRRDANAAKLAKKAAALQPRPVRAYERIRDGERQRRLITRDPRAPARHAEWGRKPTPSGLPKVSAVARAALMEARTRTLECPRCARTRRGLASLQSGCERETASGTTRRRRVPRPALREAQRDGSSARLDHAEVLRPTRVRGAEARSVAGLRRGHGRMAAARGSEEPNDRDAARELRLRE